MAGEGDREEIVALHNEVARATDSYDVYRDRLQFEIRHRDDIEVDDVLQTVMAADTAEAEPLPEMRPQADTERAHTDRVDVETGFPVFRGRCRCENDDIVIEQSVTRHVRYPGAWLVPVGCLLYASYMVLTGQEVVLDSTAWAVVVVALALPGYRIGGVILSRRRGDTGATRIPITALEAVTVAFETRHTQLRRGMAVTVPVFELRYRTGGRSRRRRIRLSLKDRAAAVRDGVAFFEQVGVPPNENSFWIREGLCTVEDGTLTFEQTVAARLGYRTGAVLTTAATGVLLTGVLGVLDWGTLLLSAGGSVTWIPAVGSERAADAIVVVAAILGLLGGVARL